MGKKMPIENEFSWPTRGSEPIKWLAFSSVPYEVVYCKRKMRVIPAHTERVDGFRAYTFDRLDHIISSSREAVTAALREGDNMVSKAMGMQGYKEIYIARCGPPRTSVFYTIPLWDEKEVPT